MNDNKGAWGRIKVFILLAVLFNIFGKIVRGDEYDDRVSSVSVTFRRLSLRTLATGNCSVNME